MVRWIFIWSKSFCIVQRVHPLVRCNPARRLAKDGAETFLSARPANGGDKRHKLLQIGPFEERSQINRLQLIVKFTIDRSLKGGGPVWRARSTPPGKNSRQSTHWGKAQLTTSHWRKARLNTICTLKTVLLRHSLMHYQCTVNVQIGGM